jgi:hypothetical protein
MIQEESTLPPTGHGFALLKPTDADCQSLYSFFGSNGDTLLDEILKYDLISKTWSRIEYTVKGDLRFSPRDSFGYASNGANLFYLFGGYSLIDDQSVLTNELWKFDADDNSLTPVIDISNSSSSLSNLKNLNS